jgi:hypothetical protein
MLMPLVMLTIERMQCRKGHDMLVKVLPSIAQKVPEVKYLSGGAGEAQQLSPSDSSRSESLEEIGSNHLSRTYQVNNFA